MELKVNGKYTQFAVGETLPMSYRHEVTCKGHTADGRPYFSAKGGRKKFAFGASAEKYLLVDGWNIPIPLSNEYKEPGSMSTTWAMDGNMSFVTDSEDVIQALIRSNVNESFTAYHLIKWGPMNAFKPFVERLTSHSEPVILNHHQTQGETTMAKKLTTGQTNLLKELGLDTLPQDGTRDIILHNRFTGQPVSVNALESALYIKSMGFYADYERGVKGSVQKFDRTKMLLMHFNSEAYMNLLD